MKTIRFLFAVAGFGALTLGITFADPSASQPSGQESNENHTISDHPVDAGRDNQTLGDKDQTDKKNSPSNANNHTPEKVSQAGPTKTPPKHPSANNSSQPASALNKTPAVAKTGLPINKPASISALLNKPPTGGGTAAPGAHMFRKQTGPTASLGGLTASSIKTSTAGINGTEMQRTTYR
jgi:hypothetical protein